MVGDREIVQDVAEPDGELARMHRALEDCEMPVREEPFEALILSTAVCKVGEHIAA
ncbi:MAG: hypothetical protein ACREFP_25855 [Acetobacteraceae bacterium]